MNINLKRAIVGLALSFSMGTANANSYFIGDLASFGDFGYTSDSVSHTKGSFFTDTYSFFLLSQSDVGASATSLYLKIGKIIRQDIPDLSLQLLSGNNVLNQNPVDGGWTLNPGPYRFEVTGNPTGTLGGKYTFSAAAAPVPEPSSWAMMLGGFGLLGFMSYRRRQYF